MDRLYDKRGPGLGMRCWRFSMYVENGEIEKLSFEPGLRDEAPTGSFEVSDADMMLAYLKRR